MSGLEPSWSQVVSVWWLITWRTMVGTLLGTIGAGFIIGLFGGLEGAPLQAITALWTIAGALLGVFWALVAVRMALRKHYRDFHLTIVPG